MEPNIIKLNAVFYLYRLLPVYAGDVMSVDDIDDVAELAEVAHTCAVFDMQVKQQTWCEFLEKKTFFCFIYSVINGGYKKFIIYIVSIT